MAGPKRKRDAALLILDLISEFTFPDAHPILEGARGPAVAIANLKARGRRAAVPVIYVNDTAGKWESDPRAFLQRCLRPTARGRGGGELIKTQAGGGYFIF